MNEELVDASELYKAVIQWPAPSEAADPVDIVYAIQRAERSLLQPLPEETDTSGDTAVTVDTPPDLEFEWWFATISSRAANAILQVSAGRV